MFSKIFALLCVTLSCALVFAEEADFGVDYSQLLAVNDVGADTNEASPREVRQLGFYGYQRPHFGFQRYPYFGGGYGGYGGYGGFGQQYGRRIIIRRRYPYNTYG